MINGLNRASTAWALMRMRYYAYCIHHVNYLQGATHASHHEIATFVFENDGWFYVDGKFI